MENTVETLLLHGDGSPEELIRKLPTLTPGVPNANNAANNNNQGKIDQDAELARQLAAAEEHAVAKISIDVRDQSQQQLLEEEEYPLNDA